MTLLITVLFMLSWLPYNLYFFYTFFNPSIVRWEVNGALVVLIMNLIFVDGPTPNMCIWFCTGLPWLIQESTPSSTTGNAQSKPFSCYFWDTQCSNSTLECGHTSQTSSEDCSVCQKLSYQIRLLCMDTVLSATRTQEFQDMAPMFVKLDCKTFWTVNTIIAATQGIIIKEQR